MEEIIKKIRASFDKADVLAWKRREKKLKDVIDNKLKPLEEKMLEIQLAKQPFFDEIHEIRKEMMETCIHPDDQLVELENSIILCKFCNKKLKLYE